MMRSTFWGLFGLALAIGGCGSSESTSGPSSGGPPTPIEELPGGDAVAELDAWQDQLITSCRVGAVFPSFTEYLEEHGGTRINAEPRDVDVRLSSDILDERLPDGPYVHDESTGEFAVLAVDRSSFGFGNSRLYHETRTDSIEVTANEGEDGVCVISIDGVEVARHPLIRGLKVAYHHDPNREVAPSLSSVSSSGAATVTDAFDVLRESLVPDWGSDSERDTLIADALEVDAAELSPLLRWDDQSTLPHVALDEDVPFMVESLASVVLSSSDWWREDPDVVVRLPLFELSGRRDRAERWLEVPVDVEFTENGALESALEAVTPPVAKAADAEQAADCVVRVAEAHASYLSTATPGSVPSALVPRLDDEASYEAELVDVARVELTCGVFSGDLAAVIATNADTLDSITELLSPDIASHLYGSTADTYNPEGWARFLVDVYDAFPSDGARREFVEPLDGEHVIARAFSYIDEVVALGGEDVDAQELDDAKQWAARAGFLCSGDPSGNSEELPSALEAAGTYLIDECPF